MEGRTPLYTRALPPRRTYRLMVVDDSITMRTFIESSHNIEELELVGMAGDGEAAIEVFKKVDPDIVTMDLTMPRMDGIECITKLVALKPTVRILVISALADSETAVEAMQKGANGFLTKPFTEFQLQEAITTLLR
jgi:two-component system, chemotaxis family, chemotaxis protein CheY